MPIARSKRVFSLALLAALAVSMRPYAQAQSADFQQSAAPSYTFFAVSGARSTSGVSINDPGTIAGHYQDQANASHGFLRSAGGAIITFDPPDSGIDPFTGTFSTDINVKGTIAGYDYDNNQVGHGFLRYSNGTIVQFDMPTAGTKATQGTFPFGINAQGVIAGYYLDSNSVSHVFVRARNGNLTSFDAPGAGTSPGQGTFAQDINAGNTIAGSYIDESGGYHGYTLDSSGAFTSFDAPSGSTYMITWGINDSGTTTGWYEDSGGVTQSFVRTSGGTFLTFGVAGATATYAQDINNAGVIAGYYYGTGFHAFLRGANGAITNADPPNCVQPEVTGINRLGAITGECTDASSVVEGFVRTPGVE